jgi:hypothetical protein
MGASSCLLFPLECYSVYTWMLDLVIFLIFISIGHTVTCSSMEDPLLSVDTDIEEGFHGDSVSNLLSF